MAWTARLNHLACRVPLTGGSGVEVRHWAWERHLPDNVPHRHAYFEVCLVGADGAGWFLVENEPYAIGPGDLFFARPGVVHQIRNARTPEMELAWVCFVATPGAEDPLLARFLASDRPVVRGAATVSAIWGALRAAAEGDAPDGQLLPLTAALLHALLWAGGGAPEASRGVSEDLARRAVRYIHDHLNRPLTVADIAAHLSVSPRHLTRLFVRFAGTAPAAYIEQARMERAGTLLVRTDDPIKMIATLVGYGDVHRFTRAFTRAVGCPPGLYRRTGGATGRHRPLTEESAGSLV